MNRVAAFITTSLHVFTDRLQDRSQDERGATAVEYGLLVGLIAVVIIAVVAALGGQLNTLFTSVLTKLGGTVPTAG
ncbi:MULTISPECIES: Flp family type IVb pilin [unclassified Isoptericola]|uniref:Flp family type IVb pilin n=1 Tax=Isoptericola sp. NPDC057191 TaxID=3346041 RepID=UPI0036350EB8